VLDIADLYKTEIGIPIAFDVAAHSDEDVGPRTRRALRDRIHEVDLLKRMVGDIKTLLLPAAGTEPAVDDHDRVTLQSDRDVQVAAGVNYGYEETW
jgi:CRISPR-associated protein Cas1